MLVEACLIVFGLSSEFNMVTFEGCFCQLRCARVVFFFSVIELVHDLYLRVGKTHAHSFVLMRKHVTIL
jgi:hypothetical protein